MIGEVKDFHSNKIGWEERDRSRDILEPDFADFVNPFKDFRLFLIDSARENIEGFK